MTIVQQLYHLLELDVNIVRHKQALASVESAIADNNLLFHTRQKVEEARATLRKQEAEHKNLEFNVESSQEKATQVESKLYGGTVRIPRELQDLQAELNILKKQQKEQEEELLQALEALEETRESLRNLESTLQEMESTWKVEHGRLLEENERLNGEMALLEEGRHGLSSLVNPTHLTLYDSLRSTRQGVAVAKVERGICQGCRIALPTRVMQLARRSTNIVQCPSCTRILYVS
jgi:predicted  nucleic acid-binding Zn-ribbon protein